MNSIIPIAQQFAPTIEQLNSLGHGLINDTYLVTSTHKTFVLQRLNNSVFKQPQNIIENLETLNQFLITQANNQLQFPLLLTTLDKQYYYKDSIGDYWRALTYIENSVSYLKVTDLKQAEQIGFALGHFHRLFNELPLDLLHTTLPDFHITPLYLQAYQQTSASIKTSNTQSQYCADFITQYQHIAIDLEQAKQQDLLKLRVIHGDPKADNFLFANHKQQVISLIDLDTVQSGLVHYDIGDCLRSCCQTLDGDFDLSFCRIILKAYLQEARHFFTSADYEFLYPAIRLLPFELGLRFYTDYLQGNPYFKVSYQDENLDRAEKQFKLCNSIMAQEKAIKTIIDESMG